MKNPWGIAFVLVCAFLGTGVLLLAGSPPRGVPLELQDAPTRSPALVHVAGAVQQPGVVSVSPDSRVRDCLAAAGGVLPSADMQALNLAAPITDGERIDVPFLAVTQAPAEVITRPGRQAEPTQPAAAPSPASGNRLNLNTASQTELEGLPKIGPVIAAKIIAYREEHGPFQSINEIMNVNGIGPAIFEQIRNLITVEN